MAMSVSSEATFFSMKMQSAICPQLRTPVTRIEGPKKVLCVPPIRIVCLGTPLSSCLAKYMLLLVYTNGTPG